MSVHTGLCGTGSVSVGYSLGFGPAVAGQILGSVEIPARLQLLTLTSVFIGMAAGAISR